MTTPLDPTLAAKAAQYLSVVVASVQNLLDLQAVGELDAETADKGVADLENDLRYVGRALAEIRKGTKAAWHDEIVTRNFGRPVTALRVAGEQL